MKVHRVADAAAGTQLAATLFAKAADIAADCPVGLATGRTMDGVYAALARNGFVPGFTDAFALDEYVGVAPNHKNSYARELREKFAGSLGWSGTLHLPGHGQYSGEEGAGLFEQVLRTVGPLSVQLLGLGVNGHIAFNEPGAAFASRTRTVELQPETLTANSVYFDDPALMPTHAVTQGLATIAQARMLLALVFGPSKQEALTKALWHPDSSTPLAAFAGHEDLVLITDLEC